MAKKVAKNMINESTGSGIIDESSELVRLRNVFLESKLNETGLLPEVTVKILDGNLQVVDSALTGDMMAGNAGSLYVSLPNSTDIIGDVVFGKDEEEPNKLVLTDVSILDEVQGHGYGRRLYLEALKALPPNYGAVCHSMLSPDAEKVWLWLVEAGIARERNQPVSGQLGKYETVF